MVTGQSYRVEVVKSYSRSVAQKEEDRSYRSCRSYRIIPKKKTGVAGVAGVTE
jgi:hypothetical protein